jgi:glycine oxidase
MPTASSGPPTGSVAVIGGGVIGLSVARRAAQAGWSVRVHRTGDPGASWVAGGMLAPHSEGWPGEERLLRLGLESLRLWREGGFLDGLPPEVITARESLVVAVDRGRCRRPAHRRRLVVRAGASGGLGVGGP